MASAGAASPAFQFKHNVKTLKIASPAAPAAPTVPPVVLTPAKGELTAPSGVNFGYVSTGTTATRTAVFRNIGQATATGVQATISGAGLTVSEDCGTPAKPVSLPGGAACTMTITYAPTAAGTVSGTLTLTSSAENNPLAINPITGQAVAPFETVMDLRGDDATVIDSTGNALILKSGVTTTATAYRMGTGAVSFSSRGTNGFLKTPQHLRYSFARENLTMEAWIRPTVMSPNALLSNYPNNAWGTNAWTLTHNHGAAPRKISFFIYNYSGSPLLASTTEPALNAWTHVAVTRSGDTWRLFINGKVEASRSYSGTLDGDWMAREIGVGLIENGGWDWGYTGQMDNVRLTRGLARYTGDFTPSY